MDRLVELRTLSKELAELSAEKAKASFTEFFVRGCKLLDYEDDDAARAFETSRPNASRWRRGKVVPPAAPLVLRLLRQLVDEKSKKLERIDAQTKGYSGKAAAMVAKEPRR